MSLEIITHVPTDSPRPLPVLFVHGAWHGAWCWENFQPYFAERGYRNYALSLRGHAASPNKKALWKTGIWDYVADVESIADHIERETGRRPVLIGHSMGGYVIQKFLERYTVPAAILAASIPSIGLIPFNIRTVIRHPVAILKSLLTLRLYPLIETPALAQHHFFSDTVPIEQVEAYHARMNDESWRVDLDGMLFNRPRPAHIKATPMLVLAARNDTVFTLKEEETTAKAYNAPLEVFDMAHNMMLDPGWESVADRIITWLDALPSA